MSYPAASSHYSGSFDIRAMVKDTIRKGVDINRPIMGSSTLLHLAIQNDLLDCVVKLLSSGADANLPNEDGATARDIALDNGNQIVLQVLSRREEYTMHLQLFNRCADMSMSTGSSMDHFSVLASIDSDLCTTDLKMVPLTIGAVYEDYFDWMDSQRCNHLQKLVESLRNEEFDLKRNLEALDTRRIRNTVRMSELHSSLRDREHTLCLDVWASIQAERHSRRALETASADVVHVKELLAKALEYVHYRGVVRAAPYKKVFFNSWHRSNVEITGSALIVEPLNKCVEDSSSNKNFFEKSFSMSFHNSKTKSSKSSRSGAARDSEGTTSAHSGAHSSAHNRQSETEDADGETEGSSQATSYATEAMLAAHALGRDGLPDSGGKNKPFISYSTGPVRRKLQKLHDCGVGKRTIPVQDIIAVEVSKIDKSLGPSYVQVELRIHYFKEGQQRLTAHSLLFSPQQPARVSIIGADGTTTETRERLISSSSNASGNGSANGSIRSTSTNSASGAAVNLASTLGVLASPQNKALSIKTTGSMSKARSISTGGASHAALSAGFDSSIGGAKGSTTATSASSTSAAASQVPSIASIPAEKLDTVWFKLPMQSNTVSRSVATGKSKSRTAGLDDGTEGPTLTFELFVAILRRVKDGVKVFSVSHGVETLYRVNPAFGDVPPSKSVAGFKHTAPHDKLTTGAATASPSVGMHRKISSSGNLCGEIGAFSTLTSASPQRSHAKAIPSMLSQDKSDDQLAGSPPFRDHSTDLRSYSPKRSTSGNSNARLSSSCGSYQGGSMNSASGLTSIESLVGITSLRGNGSSRTSLSASGSMSSSSTSYTASSLSMKGASPRYDHKFLADDTVQEETTADLQDMDEGDYSDFSMPRVMSLQALNDEDQQDNPRRFLKLTRRATEGDETLSAAPDFYNGPSQGNYIDGESDDLRSGSFSSFRVDLSDPSALAEDSDAMTTRHTISSATVPPLLSRSSSGRALAGSQVPCSPTKQRNNSFSCDTCPGTPTTKLLPQEATQTQQTPQGLPESSEPQKCMSAPVMPLRRTDSRTSAKGSSSDLPRELRSSTEAKNAAFGSGTSTKGPASGSSNDSVTAGTVSRKRSGTNTSPEDMIRYPAKLARLLEKTRSKRSKIQNRLEELLNSKEKMRECVQYLQSLMAIVDNPPPTPTRSLAKTKAPSIDKAMLLLSVYGEHINQVTDGYAATAKASATKAALNNSNISGSGTTTGLSSMGNTSEYRGKLNDAEEFVRVMLQVNANTTTSTTGATDTRSQSYGGDLRESFSSTSSRPGQSSQGAQNRLNPATGGPVVRRLFAEEASQRSFGHGNSVINTNNSTSGSGNNTRNNTVSRSSFAPPSPTNAGGEGEAAPQLLRSPPPGYKPDFDAVMSQLEDIWNCELESFQTVERLAQCLSLRGQTWQRLKLLREQEQSMAAPTKEDLYDIEF